MGKAKSKKVAKENKVLLFFAAFVFLIILAFLYVFLFTDLFAPKEEKIYMTLISEEGEKAEIYSLALPSFKLEPVFENSEENNYGGSFCRNSDEMVFVRGYGDSYQISVFDKSTEEVSSIGSRLDSFPNNTVFNSDCDTIAYWIVNDEGPSIYLMNLEGEQQEIIEGFAPLFSPDGESILFLNEGGLYVFDLNTDDIKWVFKIDDMEGNYWESLRFDYSSRNDIVITDVEDRSKYILEFDSWRNFKIQSAVYLESGFFSMPHDSPVFSPGGHRFANVGYVLEGEGAPVGYELLIYSLNDLEVEESYDFREYVLELEDEVLEKVWITDWETR